MIRTLRTLLAAFCLLVPGLAHAITGDEVLARIDKNLTFEARESSIAMTVTKSGRAKLYKMHSFGRGDNEMATEFLEPARDKGTKMLKKADDLWMYMPSVEKTQKISGHMLRQGMMGSDMSYEDLMEWSKWRESYTSAVLGEETLDGRKVYKLELKAKDTTISYPRRLIWVDQETFVPSRQELYAVSGMLLKTWLMVDVKKIEGRDFPTRMVVEDQLQKGSKTEIVFEKVTFTVALPEEVFSTRWLER